MERTTIYSSLIYGLLEWGENTGFRVGTDINININIEEVKNQFHDNGIRYNNFSFEFMATNLNGKGILLFGKFELPAQSSWRVKIHLNAGEIKTVVQKSLNNGLTTPSIRFFSNNGDVFIVDMKDIDKQDEPKNYSANEIKFIYCTVPAIKATEFLDNSTKSWERKFINSVAWDDLEKVVKPIKTNCSHNKQFVWGRV